jgi:hypothetical protein
MRPDWDSQRHAGSIEALKAQVYGRGRGSGIFVVPRDHVGDYFTQTLSLANDVLSAAKHPPNSECGEMQEAYEDLVQLAASAGDANRVAEAIVRNINARQQWNSRDAIE